MFQTHPGNNQTGNKSRSFGYIIAVLRTKMPRWDDSHFESRNLLFSSQRWNLAFFFWHVFARSSHLILKWQSQELQCNTCPGWNIPWWLIPQKKSKRSWVGTIGQFTKKNEDSRQGSRWPQRHQIEREERPAALPRCHTAVVWLLASAALRLEDTGIATPNAPIYGTLYSALWPLLNLMEVNQMAWWYIFRECSNFSCAFQIIWVPWIF